MSKLKGFYRRYSPNWLKQARTRISARVNPIPGRYGSQFLSYYEFLQQSQWWSEDRLRDYQLQQLKRLLTHAYENVPYYRRILDERGLKPRDFKDLNDLSKLPLLTKDTIIDNFDEMTARNYVQLRPRLVHTSGTTGKPLHFCPYISG